MTDRTLVPALSSSPRVKSVLLALLLLSGMLLVPALLLPGVTASSTSHKVFRASGKDVALLNEYGLGPITQIAPHTPMPLAANVTNVGSVTVNFNITIVVFNVTGGTERYNTTKPVNSLAPGERSDVAFDVIEAPGAHGTVWNVTIYANLSGDVDGSNNNLSFQFVINNTRDIGIVSYNPHGSNVEPHSEIYFGVQAKNYWIDDLQAMSRVDIYQDGSSTPIFTANSDTLYIGDNSTLWLNISTPWEVPEQETNFTVILSVEVIGGDNRPSNNNVTSFANVTLIRDAAISSVEINYWNAPETPYPTDTPLTFMVTVENRGSTTINGLPVSVIVTGPDSQEAYSLTSSFDLDPDEQQTFNMGTWYPDTEGEYVLDVRLTYTNDINPQDNEYTETLEVRNIHDLKISNITYEPSENITANDPVMFKVTIESNSNVDDSYNLSITAALSGTVVFNYSVNGILPATKKVDLTISGFIPKYSGTYNITVNLTVPGDTNNDNNLSFDLIVNRLVDLQLFSISYPIDGLSYLPGEINYLEMYVKNKGDTDEHGTLWNRLYLMDTDNRTTVYSESKFGNISVPGMTNSNGSISYTGQSSSSSASYNITLPAAYDRVWVTIEYTATDEFTVSDGEKKMVAPAFSSPHKMEFELGAADRVSLEFSGALNATIYSIKVEIQNWTLVLDDKQDILVPAGQVLDFTRDFTINKTGTYRLESIISVPFDTSPGNNKAEITFNVLSQPISNLPPTANIFHPSSGQMYHLGDTITISGNGSYDPEGSELTYVWSINGETVSYDRYFHYTFKTEGQITISLTVSDGNTESTASLTVVVQPPENNVVVDRLDTAGASITYGHEGNITMSYSRINITNIAQGSKTVVKAFELDVAGNGTLRWVNVELDVTDGNITGMDMGTVSLYYLDSTMGIWYPFNGFTFNQTTMRLVFNGSMATKYAVLASPETEFVLQPIIKIINPKNAYYIGQTIRFSAADTQHTYPINSSSYSWDFDGDGKVDAFGVAWDTKYDKPGTYKVTLAVTDEQGHNASTVYTIKISQKEQPPIGAREILASSIIIILVAVALIFIVLRTRTKRDEEMDLGLSDTDEDTDEEPKDEGTSELEKVRKNIDNKGKGKGKEGIPQMEKGQANTPKATKQAVKVPLKAPASASKIPAKVPLKAPARGRGKPSSLKKDADKEEEEHSETQETKEDEDNNEPTQESEGPEDEDAKDTEESTEYETGWDTLPDTFPFGCPKCGNDIMISTRPEDYPTSVVCPKCGAKGNLKTLPSALLKKWLDEEGIDYDKTIFDDI